MTTDNPAWDRLLTLIEWLLEAGSRQPDRTKFALLNISFGDTMAIGNMSGPQHTIELLGSLVHELSRMLRKSDVIARNGTDVWMLSPGFDADYMADKVAKVVEAASAKGLDTSKREIKIFVLPGNIVRKLPTMCRSATGFLEYAKRNGSVVRRWESGDQHGMPEPTGLLTRTHFINALMRR